MSRSFIGNSGSAGNATNAVIFTMPAAYNGMISNIIAYNSTGGSLNLTLTLTRAGTDFVILATDAVGAGATNQYARGATKPICPLVMLSGDVFKAQGSGSGIQVTVSGLSFGTS